jgi:beta-glucosidase
MCSYNRIDGIQACASNATLNTDLKATLGFKGFVMSDWLATHSTRASANGGLDMEMPYGLFFSRTALKLARFFDSVSDVTIDDKATRVVTAMAAAGLLDTPQPPPSMLAKNVTSAAQHVLSRSQPAQRTPRLLARSPRHSALHAPLPPCSYLYPRPPPSSDILRLI